MKQSASTSPFLSEDFARVYEEMADRITGPVSISALNLVGSVQSGTTVLDIAAGTGALSVPAAQLGAFVTAIDISPGMVERLSVKLARHANCTALTGNGQNLNLPANGFDATFSIFGVITFADWQKGLAEQYRVTRCGGKGCVVTWRDPDGGGPFQILASALRRVFPDRPAAPKPPGFVVLSDPARLQSELERAGFEEVDVHEIEAIWEGHSGQRYLDDLRELHRYIPSYASLSDDDRARVEDGIRCVTAERARDGVVRVTTGALIAIGTRN